MGVKLGVAVLAAAAALAGSNALADEGAYEGTWKLNVEQSHYPAMMPTIKDHVMVVSYDDGKLLKYTDNFTMGTTTSHVTFDVIVGGAQGLPDAIQVGSAVGQTGQRGSWGLALNRRRASEQHAEHHRQSCEHIGHHTTCS